jgi:hypothetical protein
MKEVHIKDNKGQVDQPSVKISKGGKGEVTWFAYGAAGATIVFSSPDGSPFKEAVFTVPATGSVSSGPAKDTADLKPYKYTVVGKDGATDPVVIIDN